MNPGTVFWGLLRGGGLLATMNSIDSDAGKRPPVTGVGAQGWPTLPSAFKATLDLIHSRGQIPLLDWFSTDGVTAGFGYDAIIAGGQDTFIDAFADQIKALPYDIFLRLNPEMNGSWEPWWPGSTYNGGAVVGGTGYATNNGKFVAFWQRVVNRFRARGCNNVAWMWCVNQQSTGTAFSTFEPLSDLYPGDAYVDYILLDGYDWAGSNGAARQTFPQVVGAVSGDHQDTWANMAALGSGVRPMGLGEWGSSIYTNPAVIDGTAKATFITDSLTTYIPNAVYGPRFRFFMWFDDHTPGSYPNGITDNLWPIRYPDATTGGAGQGLPLAAFRTAIANPIYLTGGLGPALPSPTATIMPSDTRASTIDPALVTSHSVALLGLLPARSYVYRIRTRNPAGAEALSALGTFTPGTATSAYATAVLADGPTAYYRLDEASGAVAGDSSGNAHDGTYVGGVTLGTAGSLSGDADTAVTLDGSSGYISIPHVAAFDLTGNLTLECLVFVTSRAVYQMMITNALGNGGTTNTFEFRIDLTTGLPVLTQATTTYSQVWGTLPVPLSQWVHLAVTKSGTTIQHYLNGATNGSGTITGAVTTHTQPLRLGWRDDAAGSQALNGRLDEAAIYPTALSGARILVHANTAMSTPAAVQVRGVSAALGLAPARVLHVIPVTLLTSPAVAIAVRPSSTTVSTTGADVIPPLLSFIDAHAVPG